MDQTALDNPLDARTIEALRMGRARLSQAQLLCQRMGDCGIDCRAESALCQAMASRYDRLLHHFGGTVSPS